MNKNDLLQLLGCFFNENYTNSKMWVNVPQIDLWSSLRLVSTIVVARKYYHSYLLVLSLLLVSTIVVALV